jgi:ribosomal protein S12 methylthiotransferase
VIGAEDDAIDLGDGRVLRTVEGTSAYVKISDGCDRFCTFCAIPYIRGRYFSRPETEILQEVRGLLEGGVREIVLIGQDTGIWGHDLPGSPNLAGLLRAVAREVRPYGGWVRVLYLQPEGMTDELIATMRDVDEVLPYIDIPIQHCSARILAAMNRSGSPDELRELFDRLRTEIPGMVLRTTGMAGFPGETDEEADELADFLAEQQFDYTSVFAYSPEEGTAAYALGDPVTEEEKQRRIDELMAIQEEISLKENQSCIGKQYKVIIDRREGDYWIGRTQYDSPEVDDEVLIADNGSCALRVGEFYNVVVTDALEHDLYGHIVD